MATFFSWCKLNFIDNFSINGNCGIYSLYQLRKSLKIGFSEDVSFVIKLFMYFFLYVLRA